MTQGVTYTLIILQIRFHDVLSTPHWSTKTPVGAERRRHTAAAQAHAVVQPISVEIVRETQIELDDVSMSGDKHPDADLSPRGHLAYAK